MIFPAYYKDGNNLVAVLSTVEYISIIKLSHTWLLSYGNNASIVMGICAGGKEISKLEFYEAYKQAVNRLLELNKVSFFLS